MATHMEELTHRFDHVTQEDAASGAAMARVLSMAFLFGLAAVPAYVAGAKVQAGALAFLGFGLALRFPMAGFLAVMGSGAYVFMSVLGLYRPELLGESALVQGPFLMEACAWLTLAASCLTLARLDVPTFQQAFRREGRPVAKWTSPMGLPGSHQPLHR